MKLIFFFFIEDAVGCKCDTIDVKLVVGLLGEIVVLLKDLLVDVQAILKVDVILGCTVKELAAIICDLIVVSFFLFLFFASFVLALTIRLDRRRCRCSRLGYSWRTPTYYL